MEYDDNGVFIGEHFPCISNEFPNRPDGKKRKQCCSSDALAVYEHEMPDGSVYYDAVCYSCKQGFSREEVHASSIAPLLGIEQASGVVVEKKTFENKATKKLPITKSERQALWKITGGKEGNSSLGYRGISDDTYNFYGFRFEYNKQGKVKATYFPETSKGKLYGYKSRHDPKAFGYNNVGKTGQSNDLSGQCRFPEGGKFCLVVGGEFDMCAAQEMLRNYQVKKGQGEFSRYAVVSPTTGEPSAPKQCRNQYDWFDKFDVIIVGMDSDEVGEQASLDIAKVLPKEKVRIAHWSSKDPNKMLNEGRERQFISDFFSAKELVVSGILGSDQVEDEIFKELSLEKIALPPFMSSLQEHMAGGIPLGYIVNLISSTGCGKTTIANECVYHWIFNSPYKVGVISLELDTGQYGLSLLSRHIGKKLQLIQDKDEAVAILNTPEIVEKRKILWNNEYGEKRFYLLDDRDGSLDTLKKKIEQMIIQYECRFLIIDPLQDALDGYSNEDQAVFMKWMKQIVKRYKVSFFNVNHVRKEGNSGFDRFLKEDDIQGSSAIAKSAGCNIIFTRDKLAESAISKNVTKVFIPKCRWTGSTGDGGLWYYSLSQHTLYDMEGYFKANPDKVPNGMTVEALIEEQQALHSRDKATKAKYKKQVKTPQFNKPDIMEDGVPL